MKLIFGIIYDPMFLSKPLEGLRNWLKGRALFISSLRYLDFFQWKVFYMIMSICHGKSRCHFHVFLAANGWIFSGFYRLQYILKMRSYSVLF